jgi:hypothetical protein
MEWPKNNFLLTAIIALAAMGAGMFFGSSNSIKSDQKPTQASIADIVDQDNAPSGCISIEDAQNFAGSEACVQGAIIKVFTSKSGTVFLDFCENYQECPFTAVIFKSSAKKFEDLKAFENKIVQIRGMIKTYKGKPEIIINEPSQIIVAQ